MFLEELSLTRYISLRLIMPVRMQWPFINNRLADKKIVNLLYKTLMIEDSFLKSLLLLPLLL